MTHPYEKARQRSGSVFAFLRLAIPLTFWGGLILLCWCCRKDLSVEAIVNFVPSNPAAAAAVMLVLFALKGLAVVVYGGLLYAAAGILFPLPEALLINTLGTVLMTGVPFLLGRAAGAGILDRLTEKNPRLRQLQSLFTDSEIFTSCLVRLVGLLPGDLVGMYLGASGFRYDRYLLGTLAGLLPSIAAFTVMGMSARDASTPAFWIAAGFELALTLASVVLYWLWRKKRKGAKCNDR